jgi:dipeptidyl aminopeptidase/acylaminoacyl peptidase
MQRRWFLLGTVTAASGGALTGWGSEKSSGSLAYIQQDGLWIRDLPAGQPRKLVSGDGIHTPRFSPSGKWIAYVADGAARVVATDGSVTHLPAGTRSQWNTRHDSLLVENRAGLTITAEGDWHAPSHAVLGTSLPVVFSPDGAQFVCAGATEGRGPGGDPQRTGRLVRVLLERAGGNPEQIYSKYSAGQIPCAWVGGSIFFWEDPDFSASLAADGLPLLRVPAGGGNAEALGFSTLVHEDMLSFSPRRDMLALCTGGDRQTWTEKRIAVLGGVEATYITQPDVAAICPAWAPGGNGIAYSAAPAGEAVGGEDAVKRVLAKRHLWMAHASGKKPPRQLTGDPRYRDEAPIWSTDGKYLLYGRIRADDGSKSLWLMESDGRNPGQVTGPLCGPGTNGADAAWFGYYGYIDWRSMFDWHQGRAH